MRVSGGFAFRQKLSEQGSRQILSIQLPGDALDLPQMFLDRADHNIQALTKAVVATVARNALLNVATTRPSIVRAIAVDAQIEPSISREWLLNVGRRNARSRIAHLLCEIAARWEMHHPVHGKGYPLPMSQEHLGDATGLTSVHVNRTLKSLETDGLIVRHGRLIQFPDWAAMTKEADFEGLYLYRGRQVATLSPRLQQEGGDRFVPSSEPVSPLP